MKKDTLFIRFLYHTIPGRSILKRIVKPQVSRKVSIFLNSRFSRWLVPLFVRKYRIDLNGYEKGNYTSFNDFFTRRRRAARIDITPEHLISPCDGYLTVYPIGKNSTYRIKHIEYHLEQLLENRELAKHFSGGWCLIFRITPKNYHRYCYVCEGIQRECRKVEGKLHCVRPVAYTSTPVFIENCREYVEIESDFLGHIIQMEIGALLVGRIQNYPCSSKVLQGQEKGYFEFGGSSIVILLEKNRVKIKNEIQERSQRDEETEVYLGEQIGSIQKERGSTVYE